MKPLLLSGEPAYTRAGLERSFEPVATRVERRSNAPLRHVAYEGR